MFLILVLYELVLYQCGSIYINGLSHWFPDIHGHSIHFSEMRHRVAGIIEKVLRHWDTSATEVKLFLCKLNMGILQWVRAEAWKSSTEWKGEAETYKGRSMQFVQSHEQSCFALQGNLESRAFRWTTPCTPVTLRINQSAALGWPSGSVWRTSEGYFLCEQETILGNYLSTEGFLLFSLSPDFA